MLTDESYMLAWAVYLGAASCAVLVLNSWLRRGISSNTRYTLLLLFAGLVLAPARPGPDLDLWAPALIVMPFEWLTAGLDAAMAALRSILNMMGLALVASVLLYLIRRVVTKTDTGS